MGIFDILHSISVHLPEVKPPPQNLTVRERFIWTGLTLVIFFVMYNITAFGVDPRYSSIDFLQMITASRIGSLLTTGIGPIVLASIFLQLFVGAKLIKIDLSDPKERQKFHEVQKLLAILLAIGEATIFVITSRIILASGIDHTVGVILVIAQIALGSIILLFMDEIVTKYGIGSGISLFIAAGVAFAIIGGTINLFMDPSNGVLQTLTGGGAESIPLALLIIAPLFFTALVFLTVVYAEGMKVEIPLAFERIRGMSPKLPLKLFYVSNIPVIFASAFLLNMQLFAIGLAGQSFVIPGTQIDIVPIIGYVDSSNQLRDGLLYFITPVYAGRGTLAHIQFITNGVTPIYKIPEWIHAITYVIFLSISSVIFGIFWVETAGMDSKSVADQLNKSGLQIPGWRRDPRMLEKILERYIPPLTITGAFLVGLLAGLADLTGALGTGTGILLTVGILYKMYEQMEKLRVFELYPSLGNLFSG